MYANRGITILILLNNLLDAVMGSRMGGVKREGEGGGATATLTLPDCPHFWKRGTSARLSTPTLFSNTVPTMAVLGGAGAGSGGGVGQQVRSRVIFQYGKWRDCLLKLTQLLCSNGCQSIGCPSNGYPSTTRTSEALSVRRV